MSKEEIEKTIEEIENKGAGTSLYLALLETFNKFRLFRKPKKVVLITFSTIDIFFKKILEDMPQEKRDELHQSIRKLARKLADEHIT